MNRYYQDDFYNALQCMKINNYSNKTKNIFFYASNAFREDMYQDFENNPFFKEKEFVNKYKKLIYSLNFPARKYRK